MLIDNTTPSLSGEANRAKTALYNQYKHPNIIGGKGGKGRQDIPAKETTLRCH